MTKVWTPQEQSAPNFSPRVGDVLVNGGCTCWRVGPKNEPGRAHMVYKYDRKCVEHGKGGFNRGKVWIEL